VKIRETATVVAWTMLVAFAVPGAALLLGFLIYLLGGR
jgi:hypothetical protein